MDTRRAFLKKAALLAGATSLANVIPASIQKALALNAPEGSTYLDAEHIVILMQENRSFDHCFGTLQGVRGFNDPRAIDLTNKNKVWLQSNSKGQTYVPFHLDINASKATWMSSLPHAWDSQISARNGGKHDQWLDYKRSINPLYVHIPLTLGYHNRQDIPFYYALADAFTVCDQNFCSALTGTNPNRLYFWTGTILDQQDENAKPRVLNDDMDYGTLNWTTFPERLEKQGISWKCYQNEVSIETGLSAEEDTWLSNFQDNPLEFFRQYHIKLHKQHVAYLKKRVAELTGAISGLQEQLAVLFAAGMGSAQLEAELARLKNQLAPFQTELEKLSEENFAGDFERNLHARAFNTNTGDPHYHELEDLIYDDDGKKRSMKVPKGDILHQFRQDVQTGALPTVSWLTAPESFSDHPGAPWFGAWYVSEVLDILTQQPEVWKKTIFILAYDENDGYFDHVPPFTPPDPNSPVRGKVSDGIDARAEFVCHGAEGMREPIGLGFRVPLVVVSPWTKGGWVNSQVFDHTSTLRFLEEFLSKKTGQPIIEENISSWRRTVCGDLTSVFRPYYSEVITLPKFESRDTFMESIHKSKFKKLPDNYRLLNDLAIASTNSDPIDSPFLPKQEPGIRPSCILPYQLNVDGKFNRSNNSFEITFANSNEIFGTKTAGAPFNVYAPGNYRRHNTGGLPEFEPMCTWAYAVKAGDTLTDQWAVHEFENGQYHLRVYGPNGFYREFTGNAEDPDVHTLMDYERAPAFGELTGNAVLVLVNNGPKSHIVTITDNAYVVNNHQVHLPAMGTLKVTLPLEKSHYWYDFNVAVAGHEQMNRRYAGRVETGKPGYSDPYMGRAVDMPQNIIAQVRDI